MKPPPAVSVVIPTYQRCASLSRTLGALSVQTIPYDDYEVVVSIDGSSDGTREMVSALATPYRLRWIWQPNRGRATACNAGVRESAGELIVILDDDMEPCRSFLAAHLAEHEHRARAGVLGAVPIHLDAASPPRVQFVGAKFNRHRMWSGGSVGVCRTRDLLKDHCHATALTARPRRVRQFSVALECGR